MVSNYQKLEFFKDPLIIQNINLFAWFYIWLFLTDYATKYTHWTFNCYVVRLNLHKTIYITCVVTNIFFHQLVLTNNQVTPKATPDIGQLLNVDCAWLFFASVFRWLSLMCYFLFNTFEYCCIAFVCTLASWWLINIS